MTEQREWDAQDIVELRRMVPDLGAVLTHNPVAQVYFRAGLLAARETMARFVEQGGDKATAASIRANWWPSLGGDPGAPRQLRFDEVADEKDGKIVHVNTPISVEALARAWQFLETRHLAPIPATEAVTVKEAHVSNTGPTQEQIDALADAMCMVLNDMGDDGWRAHNGSLI
jgi:hypothetical protein